MLTPRRVVHIARLIFLIGVVVLAVLVLGPFQGLEERIGLTDKSAHVIAFYLLGVSALAVAPKWRRTDLMLALLGGGVLVEVLQGRRSSEQLVRWVDEEPLRDVVDTSLGYVPTDGSTR